MNGYHTHVVKFGTPQQPTYWPAWHRPDGVLVDLRLFPPSQHQGTEKIYRPEELRKAGVPELYIEAAATSDPPGFVLLPQAAPNA